MHFIFRSLSGWKNNRFSYIGEKGGCFVVYPRDINTAAPKQPKHKSAVFISCSSQFILHHIPKDFLNEKKVCLCCIVLSFVLEAGQTN